MDSLNIAKITASIISIIVAVLCGIVEVRKNPDYWLNRFFALTYLFCAIGLTFYTSYHIIFSNILVIIPLNILGNVFFNIGLSCVIMVIFILEYSEKRVMNAKYLGIAFGIGCLPLIGYIFWPPTINEASYAIGIIDTNTPGAFFMTLTLIRVAIIIFTIFKFNTIAKRAEGLAKKQTRYFMMGTFLIVFGLILNIFSGSIELIGTYLEIVGISVFVVGFLVSVRGFLLK